MKLLMNLISVFMLLNYEVAEARLFINLPNLPQGPPCQISNDFDEPCTTEQEFLHLINRIVLEFSPDFEAAGWTLSSTSDWGNNRENASYDFVSSSEIVIKVFGGLARASDMSLDGVALVACHEIGHVYGFLTNSGNPSLWGAEGEADYFSVSDCLQRVLQHVSPRSDFLLPSIVIDSCKSLGGHSEMCLRKSRAAFSASVMRARILGQDSVSFLTPDPTMVSETTFELTSAQCGLDTFFQAALGLDRPRCWFKK